VDHQADRYPANGRSSFNKGAGCLKADKQNSKKTSQQLFYKFGNISLEILSGSVGVFFSVRSFETKRCAEIHTRKKRSNFNQGLWLIRLLITNSRCTSFGTKTV
jgi:hypothetical protein